MLLPSNKKPTQNWRLKTIVQAAPEDLNMITDTTVMVEKWLRVMVRGRRLVCSKCGCKGHIEAECHLTFAKALVIQSMVRETAHPPPATTNAKEKKTK